MKLTNKIKWGEFSPKHKAYIKNALNYEMNVAEGSVRSGKTIDHCLIFAMYLEIAPDKLHLATGSTLPNAKLNIGECNGFGLEHLFRGRCRWGKYKSNEALYIRTQTGEKIVIFSGGGKSDSYKSILGNSYGGWIATEINEHYDCEDSRTSFIKVALARQIASQKKLTLWDLNPSNPNSSIYKNYIDKYLQFKWYRYEHFTLFDNATLSNSQRQSVIDKYDENSIWYLRDILGKRVVAQGLCFRNFAEKPQNYMFDIKDLFKENVAHTSNNLNIRFNNLIMGVDFGGSGSHTAFYLTGFTNSWSDLWVLEEYEMEDKTVDSQLIIDKFIELYKMWTAKYGFIDFIFPDSASPTMINSFTVELRKLQYATQCAGVVKNEIKDRPKLINLLFSTNRLKISSECPRLKHALCSLQFDEKTDAPIDVNDDNINDLYDAFCYTFITHKDYIEMQY